MRKAGLSSIDDSKWAEVKHINCYATFMGYLWMAMRGLGVLVVTWTTVVLLGGFVSMLEKKDFWCLTVITLVQTAGIFNMHLSENFTAVPRLCLGFLHTMKITVTREGGQVRSNERPCMPCVPAPSGRFSVTVRKLVGFVLHIFQGMVLAIVLCPLAAFYGVGLYITSACSVWRLIERDYGSSDGDGANKNPALYVLYSLAVFQGLVFMYRQFLGRAGKRIANQVAEGYRFDDRSPVLGYLDKVIIGCETDPSFARGRNLITYALDLMESHSPDDLLSGTRILDTLITYDENQRPLGDQQNCRRMPMVIERLIGPSSSGIIFYKLLKALDSRSPCDREMTKRAASIVLSLAGDIHLDQFSNGIKCISSLLDASLREVNEYKELMLQGLLIMEKLVTHENNCRHIYYYSPDGLFGKILMPLNSNILHRISHDACSDLVDASLQFLCTWLNTTTGNFGYNPLMLPKESVRTMETILTCCECHKERHILAMKVLITQIRDKENIVVQLLGIFIDYKKDEYITMLAGEKLLMLSRESKRNAKTILEAKDGSVEEILRLLCKEGNEKLRICSAGILEGLCSHYIASHELGRNELCFENLKRSIIHFMPELLIQIFLPKRQTERKVSRDTDIERQINPVVAADNSQHGTGQHEDKKLQAALLSLCFTVYHNMMSAEDDLTFLLDEMCAKDPQFNLPRKLSEIVERNSDSMVVDCLRVVKYTAKMAKSMMRHKHRYSYEDLDGLMSSLERVRTVMSDLDAFVHLSGDDDVGDTLEALMREARNLEEGTEQQANELFHSTEILAQQERELLRQQEGTEITEQGRSSSGSSISLKQNCDQLWHSFFFETESYGILPV